MRGARYADQVVRGQVRAQFPAKSGQADVVGASRSLAGCAMPRL
jgi:hypothetical protein